VQRDEEFMTEALELARAHPYTSPNPRVGAVVVKDGEIIGSGAHVRAGDQHAEAAALAGIDARGATLYVTLEPCNFTGKTPPCAPAVASAGIVRVVAGVEDPDSRVAGRGFSYLRSRKIAVTVGVLEAQAKALNAPYFHHRLTGCPLVTLKLALTLDGRMGASDGTSRWITGPDARRRVHRRRALADAVADDPRLTARKVRSPRQPLRVVVDSSGRVPSTARALGDGALIATTPAAPHEVQIAWKESGAEVVVLPESKDGVDLEALLELLGDKGCLDLYCEGGAILATSLLGGGLVDRLELHYAPKLTGRGGPDIGDIGVATMAGAGVWRIAAIKRAGEDVVIELDKGD
jgi:diaminohydroxyphosphoribosylaminopyrimidine deaminase/5-amino-6-(5-phosphoribosylamino)uracil reductase